jgi:hypothetical protein
LKKSVDRQRGIVHRIRDGSLEIDSEKEFENLFTIFPENPDLYRAYGDLLARKKSLFAASDAYAMAAKLFIEEAIPLQAIVAKLLEWRIMKPVHQDVIVFHDALGKIRAEKKPVLNFWTQMSYPELLSLMLKMGLVRHGPGTMVKKFKSEEQSLNFVVSGALKETIYQAEKGKASYSKKTINLVETDFFGNIYPFNKKSRSQSDIETVTRVEIAKIEKPQLMEICKKHPKLKKLITDLYACCSDTEKGAPQQIIRRNVRHNLPTMIQLKVFREDQGKGSLILDGFIDNLSMDGACIILKDIYRPGKHDKWIGRNAKITMKLLSEAVDLTILGEIVWIRGISENKKKSILLGIYFKAITDLNRELLSAYCVSSEGEQNLMWDLWESLVKK